MHALMRKISFWAPPIVWAGLIFGLSSFSINKPPSPGLPHMDKIAHAVLFGVLAFLLFRAFRRDLLCGVTAAAVLSFVLTALYGATDEWHQSFVSQRHADLLDWAADCFGAFLGVLGAGFLFTLRTRATGSRKELGQTLKS